MFIKHFKTVGVTLLLMLLAICTSSDEKAGEKIDWQVLSNGGTINSASTNYRLGGTVGQTAVDSSYSSGFIIHHGFWQKFDTGSIGNCCEDWGTPGDANSDGEVNLLDILFQIDYVYTGNYGEPPNPDGCDELLDVNADNIINLLDILHLIEHVYMGDFGDPPNQCPQ